MKRPEWKKILSVLLMAALLLPVLPVVSALAEGYSAIVTAAQLLVYSDADLTDAVGVLTKDAVVTVHGTSGSVAKISSGTKKGFTKMSGLAKVDDVAKKAIVNTNTYVYVKADVKSESKKLAKNTKVYLLAANGAWARIEKDGNVGFVYLSTLTIVDDAETKKPVVTPEPTDAGSGEITYCNEIMRTNASLIVYKSASTATQIGTLAMGEIVTRTAYSADGWSYITQGTKKGFVRSSGLEDATLPAATATPTAMPTGGKVITCKVSAVVNRDSLPVYASADLNAKQIGTLWYGELVTVTAYNESGWASITQGNKKGFTLLSGLTPESQWRASLTPTSTPTVAPAQQTALIPCTVTEDSVAVYKGPSANSDKLGTLNRNAQVNLVMESETWAYIECGGNYGYCAANALTKNTELVFKEQTSPYGDNFISVQFTATVVCPYAKLYPNASATGTSISVTLGKEVNVYAYNNSTGWAYIGTDGNKGYMQMAYLNKDSYAALASGDSGAAVKTMQQALERLGYFDGVPAGNFGSLTTSAVKRFQSAIGMTQTASADQTMLRVLYGGYAPASPLLSANLTTGSTGTNVERLQTRLYNLKYLSKASSVDGDYGSTTASAVKLFQSAAGLSVTGSADSETLKKLYANNAPARSGEAADVGSTGSSGSSTGSIPAPSGKTSDKIELVISTAEAQLGKKYVYGATGPKTFDCSGLTQYCFKQAGVSLKRSAQQQGYDSTYAKITSISSLRRGDIVCMNTISDNDLSDHVGIYLGDYQMIHASSGGGKVMISTLKSGYYNRVFSWGRRILK